MPIARPTPLTPPPLGANAPPWGPLLQPFGQSTLAGQSPGRAGQHLGLTGRLSVRSPTWGDGGRTGQERRAFTCRKGRCRGDKEAGELGAKGGDAGCRKGKR